MAAGAFVGEHSFSKDPGRRPPRRGGHGPGGPAGPEDGGEGEGSGQRFPPNRSRSGCDPIRPYYTPRDRHGEPIKDFLKAKPVTDPDKCVKCGLCARLCPMGCHRSQRRVQVVGKCIKCCACVKKCPTGAKYFDHEGYLYHQHELEDLYARRAESKIFI